MSRKIIGILGDIGAGKSTVAEYLEKKHGFSSYTFAEPLKKIGEIFYFTKSQLYGTQQEKLEINKYHGISGREFMEKFGTDIVRETVPKVLPTMAHLWVRLFEIYSQENSSTNIVIGDVRFPDEAKTICEQGGILIKIIRPSLTDEMRRKESRVEQEKDKIAPHIEILNHGNLGDLYKNVDTAIELLFQPKSVPDESSKGLNANNPEEIPSSKPI